MTQWLREQDKLHEGIEIGLERGKLEMARNFLSLGLSIEQVGKGTGLSIQEVEQLSA